VTEPRAEVPAADCGPAGPSYRGPSAEIPLQPPAGGTGARHLRKPRGGSVAGGTV